MPTSHDSRRKILVVDDDPDTVDYVKRVLEKHSFAVITAADPVEAMDAVEAEKPDLIILDVMMPSGTEGFQFTWRLRARPEPELRNIPVIVLTAIHGTTSLRFYPDQSDGVYGPGEYLPVEAFVDKPVDEEKLLQNVDRVLARAARITVRTA
jgi:CheY-like chemotaxis protein